MPIIALLILLVLSPLAMPAQSALGPLEGENLSAYDLDRVAAGVVAPDFRLMDENGNVHQLSKYRGKNVVLVMYRGFW